MTTKLEKLSILPVNKTVIFYSPLEGKDVLVRTGTIGDGSCFYHSCLHAYSKEYASMNEEERKKFVKKMRETLSEQSNRSKWEEASNGMISKIQFQENLHEILNKVYKYITQKTELNSNWSNIKDIIDKDMSYYSLLVSLIDFKQFEQVILPESYKKTEKFSISKCKETIVSASKKACGSKFGRSDIENIGIKKVRDCIEKFGLLIEKVVDVAEDTAYEKYIESIKNSKESVDRYTIDVLSNRLKRDIYFIDGKTRMPYRETGSDQYQKRKSIIILWVDDTHYEVVGRLLPQNKVQREFLPNDPLIRKLYTYLCQPEQVCIEYPELISYLPAKYQENKKPHPFIPSDSDSDLSEFRSKSESDNEE